MGRMKTVPNKLHAKKRPLEANQPHCVQAILRPSVLSVAGTRHQDGGLVFQL